MDIHKINIYFILSGVRNGGMQRRGWDAASGDDLSQEPVGPGKGGVQRRRDDLSQEPVGPGKGRVQRWRDDFSQEPVGPGKGDVQRRRDDLSQEPVGPGKGGGGSGAGASGMKEVISLLLGGTLQKCPLTAASEWGHRGRRSPIHEIFSPVSRYCWPSGGDSACPRSQAGSAGAGGRPLGTGHRRAGTGGGCYGGWGSSIGDANLLNRC